MVFPPTIIEYSIRAINHSICTIKFHKTKTVSGCLVYTVKIITLKTMDKFRHV